MNQKLIERTQKAAETLTTKNIKETEKQLREYYKTTAHYLRGSFLNTYEKLLLSLSKGKAPTPADLYKLDKYWQLQNQLQRELTKLGDKQTKLFLKKFAKEYEDVYKAWGFDDDTNFNHYDFKSAEQIIKNIWCADGKSWSDRVWANTNKLREALNESLIECVLAGANPATLREKLMADFNVSFHRADSVVRTEIAHIHTQATQERYKEYGIKEVEVLVDKDERTCPICSKLIGKRFNINGAMPVPAHPNCRCAIIPIIE